MAAFPKLATLLVLAGLAPGASGLPAAPVRPLDRPIVRPSDRPTIRSSVERLPAEVAQPHAFHGRHGTGKKGIG
jgi:hypothetical protein